MSNPITPLEIWVQNALPTVYDNSLSFLEMVGRVVAKLNEVIASDLATRKIVDDFTAQFGSDLTATVAEWLITWKNDGTIQAILTASLNEFNDALALVSDSVDLKLDKTILINIKDLGAIGNGIADDTASFILALNANNLLIPEGNYKITENIILNGCVTMNKGAKLVISAGNTVTLNSTFKAGIHQVFSETGSVIFNQSFNSVGYPEWWGAISNDDTKDCLNAIKACIVALPVTQLQLASYYISNTLVLDVPHRTLQGLDDYGNDSLTNKGTTIIIKSASATGVYIGLPSSPSAGINDFLKQVTVKNLQINRDRPVMPPVDGNMMNSACGIKIRFTLFTYCENVRCNEHSVGFCVSATVRANFNKCIAFRSGSGVIPLNDLFYGFLLDGDSGLGAAGGNASTYILDSGTSIGGNPTLSDSCGFMLLGKPVDSFLLRPEVTSCAIGIKVVGDGSISGNVDLHIINAIIDSFTNVGIYLQDIGEYGAIDVSNSYVAPVGGAVTTFGIRVADCVGMIALTNNQCVGWQNSLFIGMWVEGSMGVISKSNMILGSTRPIVLIGSDFNKFDDIITNNSEVTTEGVYYMSESDFNTINSVMKGHSNVFTHGVEMNGLTCVSNEINVTMIKNDSVIGGSQNKVFINGVGCVAVGITLNNLLTGIL